MSEESVKMETVAILNDETLSTKGKIDRLEKLHADVRAEMRAATESAMVSDNDIGAELKLLEDALDQLNHEPEAPEDGGGATL